VPNILQAKKEATEQHHCDERRCSRQPADQTKAVLVSLMVKVMKSNSLPTGRWLVEITLRAIKMSVGMSSRHALEEGQMSRSVNGIIRKG